MICGVCNKKLATQRHHKFPQYKRYRKLYRELIDHQDNLIPVCADCHMVKSLPHWTELEFCQHFGIKPRSKELLQRIAEGKIKKFWEDAA